MTKICRRMLRYNLKRTIIWRVTLLRRCAYSFWNQILSCWIGSSIHYRQLQHSPSTAPPSSVLPPPPPPPVAMESSSSFSSGEMTAASTSSSSSCYYDGNKDSSDLVALKISLLGDCHIGKTSFLAKYVGKAKKELEERTGINQMDKTLCVRGARISYSIWEVGGDAYCLGNDNSRNHFPAACKDSVAMLFMFDLTSRCTLNSVIKWYEQARKWNQTAIPVIVGTKFDDFVQLPIDLQWTIASQARAYARALNATLFFSSASYNINVNKIFKFITARLFNLPWTVERNLTIGEPIIDF